MSNDAREPMSREAFDQMMAVRKYEDERADRQAQIAEAAAMRREALRMRAEADAREREDEEQTAARVRAEEEQAIARMRADEVAAYARRVFLGARQAKALAICLEALEELAQDTTLDDEAYVDEARDRVLRSLRANFFDPAPTIIEKLSPMLPQIIEVLGKSMMARPPSPVPQVIMEPFRPRYVEERVGYSAGYGTAALERSLADLVRQYAIGQLPGFKLQVHRTWPKIAPGGRKMDGFLGEYDRAIGEHDIAREYGGGEYRVIVKGDGPNGKHYASVRVDIAGDAKHERMPYDPSTSTVSADGRVMPPPEATPEAAAAKPRSGILAQIMEYWPSVRVSLSDDDLDALQGLVGAEARARGADYEEDVPDEEADQMDAASQAAADLS